MFFFSFSNLDFVRLEPSNIKADEGDSDPKNLFYLDVEGHDNIYAVEIERNLQFSHLDIVEFEFPPPACREHKRRGGRYGNSRHLEFSLPTCLESFFKDYICWIQTHWGRLAGFHH